jgi:hypothetical protein
MLRAARLGVHCLDQLGEAAIHLFQFGRGQPALPSRSPEIAARARHAGDRWIASAIEPTHAASHPRVGESEYRSPRFGGRQVEVNDERPSRDFIARRFPRTAFSNTTLLQKPACG